MKNFFKIKKKKKEERAAAAQAARNDSSSMASSSASDGEVRMVKPVTYIRTHCSCSNTLFVSISLRFA